MSNKVSALPAEATGARAGAVKPPSIGSENAKIIAAEMRKTVGGPSHNQASLSFTDRMGYAVENSIAANPSYPFRVLGAFTAVCLLGLGVSWYRLSSEVSDEVFGQSNVYDAIFIALQLIISAGYDDAIPDKNGLRQLFVFILFFGLVVFAVFIGFITDAVSEFMDSLEEGKTKVAAEGHTLILGWNEATMRSVVQMAFLRRQYQQLNEGKLLGLPYFLPFLNPTLLRLGLLERPSTSLAVADIVIMTDTLTKEEMHDLLAETLDERGINPRRTKLGKNIVCRIGDPTNPNDLIRVGAHRAAAILVMTSEQDAVEEAESDGQIRNGATLRTVLALRHVLFSIPYSASRAIHPDLRIVLQMTSTSEYVDAACFTHPNGIDVVVPMDLTKFLNSLMFICAAQPGLSRILLAMLDFEGKAIRRRRATNLRSGPNNSYGHCIGRTFGEVRKHFSAAVFIGMIKPGMSQEEIKRRGYGLCPDPDKVIEPDDMLIFVGAKSSPVGSTYMTIRFNEYQAAARKIREQHPEIEKNRLANSDTNSKVQSNLLVCGWRPIWQHYPKRLYARMTEIARQRLPGSVMVFVNAVPADAFAAIMKEAGLTAAGANEFELPAPFKGIKVRHKSGDAANPAMLKPVIDEMTINTAIVLGTQANHTLAGNHRDTRVLNILLLLRKLWSEKNEGVPMHIVGENSEDMTARLALAPRRAGDDGTKGIAHAPDFVNSQAVTARALAQTLAYPLIQPAVQDLFSEEDDAANIVSVDASEYCPLNVKLKYGVVRALVLSGTGERSICIGLLHDTGETELLPAHDKEVMLNENDRLVILRRKLTGLVAEGMKEQAAAKGGVS